MKSSQTVLCVSHDPDTCEILTILLSDVNFKSEHVDTPAEALQRLRARKFAAVVTAFYLADISGPEFCREMRKFDQTTPVIFYSGAASPSEIAEGLEAGAQAYLVKPDDLERLCDTILTEAAKASELPPSSVPFSDGSPSFA